MDKFTKLKKTVPMPGFALSEERAQEPEYLEAHESLGDFSRRKLDEAFDIKGKERYLNANLPEGITIDNILDAANIVGSIENVGSKAIKRLATAKAQKALNEVGPVNPPPTGYNRLFDVMEKRPDFWSDLNNRAIDKLGRSPGPQDVIHVVDQATGVVQQLPLNQLTSEAAEQLSSMQKAGKIDFSFGGKDAPKMLGSAKPKQLAAPSAGKILDEAKIDKFMKEFDANYGHEYDYSLIDQIKNKLLSGDQSVLNDKNVVQLLKYFE